MYISSINSVKTNDAVFTSARKKNVQYLPKEQNNNKKKTLIAGGILGFVAIGLAAAYMFLRHRMSGKISTRNIDKREKRIIADLNSIAEKNLTGNFTKGKKNRQKIEKDLENLYFVN